MHSIQAFKSRSEAAKIVVEELDIFFERVKLRLNELPELRDVDAVYQIRDIMSKRFGTSVAKDLVMTKRKPNKWNGFQKKNSKTTREQLKEKEGLYYMPIKAIC
jgi:hypothetical protein